VEIGSKVETTMWRRRMRLKCGVEDRAKATAWGVAMRDLEFKTEGLQDQTCDRVSDTHGRPSLP
jgi:hypothetical protein